MKKLLQIIYISRSTFEATEINNKIEPNIARILSKSRVNNRINGLVGVLYFGDGVFFQCLEGEEGAVNTLLTKLEADTRHKDLKVIAKKYVDSLSFQDWAMKYAPIDEQIKQFLKDNNFNTFDPYQFSGDIINKFLKLLFNANNATNDSEVPLLRSTANEVQDNTDLLNAIVKKSNIALTLSIVALVLSSITIIIVM